MEVSQRVKLNNGLEIPGIGLGFWESSGEEAIKGQEVTP